jgi:hypothetical protein
VRRGKRVAEAIEERSFVVTLLMGDGWTGVGAADRGGSLAAGGMTKK